MIPSIKIARKYALSALLIGIFVIMATIPGYIAPYGPSERFGGYQTPSTAHIMGTDDMGRDIFSLLVHAARLSLLIGVVSGVLAIGIGVIVGLLSGWLGGIWDDIFMGLTDTVLILPKIPLIIVMAAYLEPGPKLLIVTLGLLSWESGARVVRAKVLQVRTMGFVLSARCFGFSSAYILSREILPVLFPVIVPKFVLVTASAMIAEASLSFLGLSDPTMISWGVMISDAFTHSGFIRHMWYWWLPPTLCIILGVCAITSIAFLYEGRTRELIQL
ncbi:MAG: ABC transporter permease [Methanomicrobiales archaeon]|nr:ABC transporter permease [Methanomicrobiales archaeon]